MESKSTYWKYNREKANHTEWLPNFNWGLICGNFSHQLEHCEIDESPKGCPILRIWPSYSWKNKTELELILIWFLFCFIFLFQKFQSWTWFKGKSFARQNAIKIIAKLDLILMILLLQKLMSINVVLKMKNRSCSKDWF